MKTKLFIFLIAIALLSCTKEVEPEPEPEPAPLPVANFIISGANEFAPSVISFTNQSVNAETYNWDFGDGTSSQSVNAVKLYSEGGLYNVTLTAYNADMAQSVISKTLYVKPKPTRLKLNKITLTGMPFTNSQGAGWDSNSGPDVYFEIFTGGGTSIYKSDIRWDILPSYLPINFTEYFPISFSDFTHTYAIKLFDYDWPSSDDYIGGYTFKIIDWMPSSGLYLTELDFYNYTSQLRFTLYVEWLE
ncbi:MAG: PKD domain-containing protein [Bacteroidetes bacterium]|nr:PKD domain-containing protein [Bacteroidota bacterium]